MRYIGKVCGSGEQAKPLIIGKDTVYVHTDIMLVKTDGRASKEMFSYTEVQYTIEEYLHMMVEKNEALSAELTDTQLALCEIYELSGGEA